MQPERAVFLVTAFATHAAVGYALVRAFTSADPRVGAVLALAPDGDFLLPAAWDWPFVHRGITHAPAFALAVVAVAYAIRRRRSDAAAVALGLGSHLAIDALSPKGIPLAYPMEVAPSPGLSVHGPLATIVLWALVAWLLATADDGIAVRIRRPT